jgi:hypothetical protein
VTEVRGHPHILEACSKYLDALDRLRGQTPPSSEAFAASTATVATTGRARAPLTRVPALNSAIACIDLDDLGPEVNRCPGKKRRGVGSQRHTIINMV